jgi:hypothetical protein
VANIRDDASTFDLVRALNSFDLLLDVPDAPINLSPVGFQLSFARSAGANAAAKLRHLHTTPGQPRKHVFELRKFDLQLALTSAGVPREDIEDQLGAINNAGVNNALDIALLRRREIVVEQNNVGGNRGRRARDLFELSFADQCGRVGSVLALGKFSGNLRARARGQRPEFVKRFFGAEVRRIAGQGRR